ncbi:MAG: Dabb family protein [Lachnospiraceae bacterium]|nr:Dabb family protein [Lachnospiraceae bacterium]
MMHHCIIAKFKPEIEKEKITEMFPAIREIFEHAKSLEGVQDVIYHRNCIDRPNRYDLSISIVMDKEALPLWDACQWHKQWKEEYGDMLEKKCIFDFED